MNTIRTLILAAAVALAAAPLAARESVCLNPDWRFILADDPAFGRPDFDDSRWRRLDLPHDWSIEGPYDKRNPSGPQGGYLPCGTGWYRKSFRIAPDRQGRRFFVRFDGVYMKSQTWINGRMVGEYPNGYNSFEYDITPFVRFDTVNVLAVRVDNSLQPGSRWYSGSGIYRDVHLVETDQLHFVDGTTFVTTPRADSAQAVVRVDCQVVCNNYPETVFNWTDNTSLFVWLRDENAPDAPAPSPQNNRVQKECTLTSVLYDPQGREVGRTQTVRPIGDFSRHDFSQEIPLDRPRLWSPDSPALYRLVTTIGYDGRTADSLVTPVGIRSFRFSAERGMELNGKPLKIQGVCIHQNIGCFGSATPPGAWKERLLTLKAMGCNAIRTHYPLFPAFQDMCDTLGILVSKEIFDEWNRGQEWGYSESSYGKMPYTYHLYFEQWAETDLRRMIRRDRNHPSVFLYMLGNEIPNQRIEGIGIARKLKAIAREEDPTRPVTAACDFFVGANIYGFMDEFDIAGYNYIDRIHTDSLYAAEHARYPGRILLGTETYHATKNHVSIRDTPSAIGEFVWVGYDYLGEIVWPDYRGWSEGILDIAGFPKPEYYLRKSYWSSEPVVHIAVERSKGRDFQWSPRDAADHWNWADKGREPLPVYVYSNCDEVELSVAGRSLGRKKVGRDDYHALWSVPFRAGTVTATGYRDGKRVASHTLRTAGEPYALNVSRAFRYGEFVRAELEVVDRDGVRVPDCDAEITVGITAGSVVLGIDNGGQYDPQGTKYTSKEKGRCFDGRLVVYLKPSSTSGRATFSSPGLRPSETKL